MREVPAKLFGFMREMSRRAGADVEAAQAGLALRNVDVDAFGERVDWDELALFLERAHGDWTHDEIEKLGETYVQTHRWQQVVARMLATPRLLFQVSWGLLTKPAFPHLDLTAEALDDGMHLELWLPEGFEPSFVFFHGTTGQLRMIPTLFGRPPAEVKADTGPRHGIWEVYLDEPPTRLDRAVGAAQDALDLVTRESISLLHRALAADAQPAPSENRVLELQRQLDLTRMEARVAVRLASGMSVKEIARALRIRISTVRSHLRVAYAKTGTRGQSDLVRLVLTGAESGAS